MTKIQLYNTNLREKEEFTPIVAKHVGMYCCGPTVYHYAHIGNMRTYVFEDMLARMFRYNGYTVKHVMNITDVGHLSDDGDDGEDKMELGAKREGKTVWQIAEYYTNAFFKDTKELNILLPTIVCKATDHIKEQIEMIQLLEKNGHTYKANGNVYFDTSTFPDYKKFANLQEQNEESKKHQRVDTHEGKKNPEDFVLWFTQSKFKNHAMKWDSPWGTGYPGWHIECSAMSTQHLGKTFDIHCGGIDHVPVHHTNEIAQSVCAHKGENYVNYWLHSEFIVDDTGKMSKSKGEFLTVQTLKEKGYNPLAYRYLICMTHYRKQLHFTYEALDAAQTAYLKLKQKIAALKQSQEQQKTTKNTQEHTKDYEEKFVAAISDDLNIPKALGILHEMLADAALNVNEKLGLITVWDDVFGLELLAEDEKKPIDIPEDIKELAQQRATARAHKDYAESDRLRDEIAAKGFEIVDNKDGTYTLQIK